MILLVHMLFGAAVGSQIPNIYLAIIVAFLGHYFLDLFPHIEYLEGVEGTISKVKSQGISNHIRSLIKVFIDFLLGLLIIYFLGIRDPLIYMYALVAIVPDGLTVLHTLFPTKLSTKHHEFHGGKVHFLKHKKISTFWRITTQAAALIISAILLRY